jgi:molybdenum cofactor cytidylyltransferase
VIAAIILAAGSSTRMGQPKAGLVYQGETFMNRLVRLMGAECDPVIVVTSAPASVPGSSNVINPDPSRGMLSSLQCGLRAVPAEATAIAFLPVDLPAVSDKTIAALVNGWSGESLRIPRFNGHSGHPVIIERALIAEFLSLPDTAKPSDVIHRFSDKAVYVDVDDPGTIKDIDTPADYEALLMNCGASFSLRAQLAAERSRSQERNPR